MASQGDILVQFTILSATAINGNNLTVTLQSYNNQRVNGAISRVL